MWFTVLIMVSCVHRSRLSRNVIVSRLLCRNRVLLISKGGIRLFVVLLSRRRNMGRRLSKVRLSFFKGHRFVVWRMNILVVGTRTSYGRRGNC